MSNKDALHSLAEATRTYAQHVNPIEFQDWWLALADTLDALSIPDNATVTEEAEPKTNTPGKLTTSVDDEEWDGEMTTKEALEFMDEEDAKEAKYKKLSWRDRRRVRRAKRRIETARCIAGGYILD